MKRTVIRRCVIGCGLVSALLGSGALGYARGVAQVKTRPIAPIVLSGGDVGFRMVGWQEERAVGVLMVRVDGKWVYTAAPWDVNVYKR